MTYYTHLYGCNIIYCDNINIIIRIALYLFILIHIWKKIDKSISVSSTNLIIYILVNDADSIYRDISNVITNCKNSSINSTI